MWARKLDRLTVASPCHVPWDRMMGDKRTRSCEACNREVHDLSKLTRKQALDLFERTDGRLCGRILYRPDGRVLFAQSQTHRKAQRLLQISLLTASAAFAQTARPGTPVCTASIKVADAAGAAMAGAQVVLKTRTGAEIANGPTDSAGSFSRAVDAGQYVLSVLAPGFQPYTQRVDLNCGSRNTVTLRVEMQLGMIGEIVPIETKRNNPFYRVWRSFGNLIRRIVT